MQAHHAQALEMALLVRDKSTNEEIRTVANDIATAQQHQSGQMFAWLQEWGLSPARSGPLMAWMAAGTTGHAGSSGHTGRTAAPEGAEGAMEGMATPAQMQALRDTSGAEADRN